MPSTNGVTNKRISPAAPGVFVYSISNSLTAAPGSAMTVAVADLHAQHDFASKSANTSANAILTSTRSSGIFALRCLRNLFSTRGPARTHPAHRSDVAAEFGRSMSDTCNVAELADVSIGTVFRVLNNKPGASEPTQNCLLDTRHIIR